MSQTDKHRQTDNMKTVYPQQTQFAGGYNNWHNFAFINLSYSLKSGTLAQILKKKQQQQQIFEEKNQFCLSWLVCYPCNFDTLLL